MKSYTDIEQSKKLAEILPLESADKSWKLVNYGDEAGSRFEPSLMNYSSLSHFRDRIFPNEDTIPCWSLTALVELLPDKVTINNEKYCLVFNKKVVEYRGPVTWDGQKSILSEACNLIDACFEMILKLHEQNLI